MTCLTWTTATTLAAASVLALASAAPALADPAAPASDCAPLHLLLANGTGEARADIATDSDSGFTAQIAIPALARANTEGRTLATRSYIAYNAGGGPMANKSVEAGLTAARAALTDISARCPEQRVMLLGHMQGAQLMAGLAREIGSGKGAIKADRIAGVALFSDPTRATGQPIFANKQGPQQIPQSRGKTVSDVRLGMIEASTGGGLSPITQRNSFGSLSGRVASFCNPGDITCDIPADAALMKLIGNLAASSKLDPSDPIGMVTSISSAVGQSLLYTGASLINDTVNFSGGQLNVNTSSTTVLDRMIAASNPNARPGAAISTAVRALAKVAGMGINAAITIGKEILTPGSIVEIGAAGLGNPAGALALVGTKLVDAVIKLVPPVAVINAGMQVFTEIQKGIVDNAGLVQVMLDTRYWDLGAARTSYDTTPIGAQGQSAVALSIDWIAAAATDLAATAAAKTSTTAKSAPKPGPVLGSPDQPVLSASAIVNNPAPQGK